MPLYSNLSSCTPISPAVQLSRAELTRKMKCHLLQQRVIGFSLVLICKSGKFPTGSIEQSKFRLQSSWHSTTLHSYLCCSPTELTSTPSPTLTPSRCNITHYYSVLVRMQPHPLYWPNHTNLEGCSIKLVIKLAICTSYSYRLDHYLYTGFEIPDQVLLLLGA